MRDGLDKRTAERIWKHSVLAYIEERLFGEGDRLNEFDLQMLRGAEDSGTAGDADGEDDA